MVLLFKKSVTFASDAENIHLLALMRKGNPRSSDTITNITADFSISKMPIANDMFLNDFVGTCFSSDKVAIGKIFKIFAYIDETPRDKSIQNGSAFLGLFEVRPPHKLSELFIRPQLDALEAMVQILDVNKDILAVPSGLVSADVSGSVVAMHEYPIFKPSDPFSMK
ncbi:MAG: hypothetical protein M1360_02170 [Candidatus Marsarchaeota archaeon]|nr:hypothetical protein [Candidatus Marsarchaeota archaeon]MCL5418726.1 hypothetical protein [Candidatus Marsarchaeota archaeon]